MVASDKERKLVIHVAPAPSGGGAEVLAKRLSEIKTSRIQSKAIYFFCSHLTQISKEDYCLGISPRSIRAIFKIRQLLKMELRKYEKIVVHAHLTWPLFFCRFAALGLPVILVYTEHSTYNKRRDLPFFRMFDRWFYKGYRSVICISSAVRDALKDWLGSDEQLVVINNGAQLGRYHPMSRRRNGVHLVSVGRLVPAKGFDISIRAISEMRNEIDSYRIWGDGPSRNDLQALIESAGAEDFIRLMGWSDDIHEVLSEASMQVIPSRWEGFGLVAVEGMSTGLAVLASAVPGLSEVVGEGIGRKLVQNFDSPTSWKEAIRDMRSTILSKKDLVSIDARSHSEMFSIDKMKASYVSFYQDIADTHVV